MATHTNRNFNIVRGDTISWDLTIKKDGVALNITGYKFYLTCKTLKADADPGLFQITVTSHTDAVNGRTLVEVPAATTDGISEGLKYYDLQMKDGSGKITTVMIGTMTFMNDITRTVA